MDIVRIFQQFCINNDYYFSYGTTSVQNLLTNPDSFNEDKVHLLLEPVRRRSDVSNGGLSVRSRSYSGKYMFVVRDNFDLNYFNEKGTDEAETAREAAIGAQHRPRHHDAVRVCRPRAGSLPANSSMAAHA